jgi:hypothetical protein
MSMVEGGLGISVLPELILKRIPYRIVIKELDVPAYRKLGLAMRITRPENFRCHPIAREFFTDFTKKFHYLRLSPLLS